MIYVSHFIGLSGIGGVQLNFTEYFNNQYKLDNKIKHKVYTLGDVDHQYKIPAEIYNIMKLKNLLSLILDIISSKVIVHFYNNLTSVKLFILLFFFPVKKIILHERGAVWNLPSSRKILLKFVSWKADLILANSNATKIMLEKKFNIYEKKIIVIYNGVDIKKKCIKKNTIRKSYPIFRVGFIGRLDTPKGVHVLINAMYHLRNKNIKLVIAGEGVLEHMLKKNAAKLNNVQFIGRVKNPYLFMNKVSLLVVPSIREPLGNVCLEAGLCKVPVLATNVDGLPEIIENGISGELIDATDQISIDLPEGSIPLPEFVVNPDIYELQPPKQINSSLLAKKILELSMSPDRLKYYADNLHNKVTKYFNIHRYRTDLHKIYSEIYFMDNF